MHVWVYSRVFQASGREIGFYFYPTSYALQGDWRPCFIWMAKWRVQRHLICGSVWSAACCPVFGPTPTIPAAQDAFLPLCQCRSKSGGQGGRSSMRCSDISTLMEMQRAWRASLQPRRLLRLLQVHDLQMWRSAQDCQHTYSILFPGHVRCNCMRASHNLVFSVWAYTVPQSFIL